MEKCSRQFRRLVVTTAVALALLIEAPVVHGPRLSSAAAQGAFTGFVHTVLADPVVDAVHHRVYGYTANAIVALDEITGEVSSIVRFSKWFQPEQLAVATGNQHLLFSQLHIDKVMVPSGAARVTAIARVIDGQSGRILGGARIQSFVATAYIAFQGAVAVDPGTGYGIAVDIYGHAVMLDMGTGALVRRFSTSPPTVSLWPQDPAVVDARTHRLFLNTTVTSGLPVIDTRSGRLIRSTAVPVAGTPQAIDVDRWLGRVFVVSGALTHWVSVLSATSGAVLRRVPLSLPYHDDYFGATLIADSASRRLFVCGEYTFAHRRWMMTVFDDATMRIVSVAACPRDPALFGVDPVSGRVFVVGTPNHVSVYDAQTGRHLGAIALDGRDTSLGMAVDGAMHRLFLCGRGGVLVVDTQAAVHP